MWTAKPAPHSVLGHVGGDIHVRCAVGGEVRGAVWGTVWVDPHNFGVPLRLLVVYNSVYIAIGNM